MSSEVSGGEPILVVDDSPQNVKLMRAVLTGAGYRVIEAASGPEALDKLHGENPAAVILDVRMPGMNGYEVCRNIRRDPQRAGLPVIMLTALSLPEERIRGIEAGATDFITKPFSRKELLARLRASLDLSALQRSHLIDPLPGGVVVVTAQWRILFQSRLAAALLGLDNGAGARETDLRERLQLPAAEAEALEAGRNFRLQAVDGRTPLIGRATAVIDPHERIAMRTLIIEQLNREE